MGCGGTECRSRAIFCSPQEHLPALLTARGQEKKKASNPPHLLNHQQTQTQAAPTASLPKLQTCLYPSDLKYHAHASEKDSKAIATNLGSPCHAHNRWKGRTLPPIPPAVQVVSTGRTVRGERHHSLHLFLLLQPNAAA